MNTTLEKFKLQQEQATALLSKVKEFLKQGQKVGVPIDDSLVDKVERAIREAGGGRLKIVLVGGFSEGKTSIAAAWIGRLDRSTMKISHEESSDEVASYVVGNDILILDTPGLFGFKEKTAADKATAERYKDITRKYISEAHLVLYVMDPKNPIKQSHGEELKWLFRSLNLLPRTVFVLSRFDLVADVEDLEDFRRNLQVKRSMVISRLGEEIQLLPEEQEVLSVVAVAANPFDLGVEHWLANPEQFGALSHISDLQRATSVKVEQSGGPLAVVQATKQSVIRDVLTKQLPVAVKVDAQIQAELEKLDSANGRLQKQLTTVKGRISDVRIGLRKFVTTYFTDLILQARGLDQNTYVDFFEREIGNEGVVLAAKLQSEFERQLNSVKLELTNLSVSVDAEVNHFNAAVRSYGKQGVDYLIGGKLINGQSVKAARDGIAATAKVVGLDLGKYLKFKPWGAVKLAKTLNGAVAIVGLAFDLWEMWESNQRERAFRKSIEKLIENFEAQRMDLMSLIDSPDFESKFFADYENLSGQAQELAFSLEERQAKHKEFQAWRAQAEALDAEVRTLSSAS
ncbi:50S ribosome-binding GTPase [Ideonella sp. B7]|uniref:LeoA/HP0731 family dynamin-like GTPase n=1 Tax=Ideonella benzenivorans TaxID=2831643 RepID=UPI001CEDEA81|nr:LeoA/HP0731 family dynamin-like GTPase [Ideonella benzenivorans]MCA6217728.1 50S ribosome-binding GTPase [Ideonella benzenivorans]